MKKYILSTFIFLLALSVTGQNNPIPVKVFSCPQILKATDSKYSLFSAKAYKIDLICSPVGSGVEKEVESSVASEYYFEKEHNVAWIKFTAAESSKLTISIAPKSSKDDYDFLLFKEDGIDSKAKIASKELKPIRSNIARTMDINNGLTGLTFDAKNLFMSEGVKSGFSKYIEVKENENYYLVLDNVYDNGQGAIITFNYFETKSINGIVTDENKKPVAAQVTWEETSTGEELAKTTSDPVTGVFKLDVPYNKDQSGKYILSTESDGFFYNEVTYTSNEISSCPPTPIRVVLPELKAGKRTTLNNINFEGGVALFLPTAKPSLERLAKLMKKNPRLKILIEGHTNGCPGNSQELSEHRALAVKNYLVKNKISADRINTIGLNCEFMLYPLTSNEGKQSLNRRVEIVVEDY